MKKDNKIGIVLPHLGSSQMAFYSIARINNIIKDGSKFDFTLFYETMVTPCISPMCATMCVNELPTFNGTIITSTIENSILANKLSVSKTKLFYIWDMEWTRVGKQDFMYNTQAFNNDIVLIARSQDHVWAIENYCNRKVDYVIKHFNLKKILEITNGH